MAAATAYPLAWPDGFPRSKAREKGRFTTTLAAALANVQTSLRLFGSDSGKPIVNLVMSSNVTLGGLAGDDPGVAVYFTWDGVGVCIPVDRYSSVASNLQAIHHIVEARRVELRHGTLALVHASFAGFRALPSPDHKRSWRDVLELPRTGTLTADEIGASYRRLARERHPDHGGSDAMMAELNRARGEAFKEMGIS